MSKHALNSGGGGRASSSLESGAHVPKLLRGCHNKLCTSCSAHMPCRCIVDASLPKPVLRPVAMLFANNAVYCPESTAVDAGGLNSARLRDNYVHGRLVGATLDNTRWFDGGTPESAFLNASGQNFWPAPESRLRGRSDSEFLPAVDFNGTKRLAPFDVGAYESDGRTRNSGWTIQAGFKQ